MVWNSVVTLAQLFAQCRDEDRAALIGYLPAGFPTKAGAIEALRAMIKGGVDAIEVGFPYSDPVMDGPTIEAAAAHSLAQGTGAKEVLETVAAVSDHVPTVVMSYWNPIERYGVHKFAEDLAAQGGVGVITPDLTLEEADSWVEAATDSTISPIFVVAPSSSDQRLKAVTAACTGFVYAASTMGVTGVRTDVSSVAPELVARVRRVTDLPVAVGLGVSNQDQARAVAGYADGVIVGSAFVRALETGGPGAVESLARDLAQGVRHK